MLQLSLLNEYEIGCIYCIQVRGIRGNVAYDPAFTESRPCARDMRAAPLTLKYEAVGYLDTYEPHGCQKNTMCVG